MKSISHVAMIYFVFNSMLCFCRADDSNNVQLPKPNTTGGTPLMETLANRKSSRQFSSKDIPLQILSDMLWAAWGVNRSESGKRTAPSAVNWQEIDIYVALKHGLYLYDASEHTLLHVFSEDIRGLTGRQEFVKHAPVNLIFVADHARMGRASQSDKDFYSATDAGFISQNIYLFCASEGLATVVRGALDRSTLREIMKLSPTQKIILAQTVGYPGN